MNFVQMILYGTMSTASLLSAAAQAATYYVSPAGSNSNSGTSWSAPWATLQKAADTVVAGDTVYVGDGVYTTSADTLVTFSRSGTSGAWITFKSSTKWGAKLSGNNQATATAAYFGATSGYIKFDGFEISNFNLIAFSVYGSNLIFEGNLVHHIGRICTDASNGRVGASISGGQNILIDRNTFNDIGRFGPGESGCNPSTQNYQNLDHGLYMTATNNVTVTNNLFFNFKHGWAINLYPNTLSGLWVKGNTFIGANPWRDGQILVAAGLSNSVIEQNIMLNSRTKGIDYNAGSMSGVRISNNWAFPGPVATGTWPGGVTISSNLDNTDPGLFMPQNWTP
jgi:hypothetical protein